MQENATGSSQLAHFLRYTPGEDDARDPVDDVLVDSGDGARARARQPAEEVRTNLQGTWSATRAHRDGKRADDVVGHRLSFVGNRFQIRSRDGQLLYEGLFRVNPSTKPAAIDFEHAEGTLEGTTWKGIYELKGDTLTICDNAPDPDKGRPAAFEATPASGYILITFTRATP